jgi:flagellin
MVVQHNLTAMNSNRMLNVNTKTQAKSTEKLSSGFKINRAADDAAGLSISEKMRKQIRGLTQASANAQDGISAVQTAEGALNEVQDMLQRMNELAVKSANGTNSTDDRSYIQNEIDQLVTEIDRVAETTKFNETYLLKGDSSATKVKQFSYTAAAFAKDGGIKDPTKVYYDANGNWISENALSNYIDQNGKATAEAVGKLYTKTGNATDGYTLSATALAVTAGTTVLGASDNDASTTAKLAVMEASGTGVGALELKLHVGADATSNNQISVSLNAMSAKGIGVDGLKVDGTDDKNALTAIETIKTAIQKISTQRSALGAVQNRLDHTINNLDNVVENTTSAESAIRDTDMATEMVRYSNNNILSQAGQAMLAQANQSNQGVLALLR